MGDASVNDAIKVMCRFRPLNSSEKLREDVYLPKFKSETSLSFSSKSYNFDRVFASETTQKELYNGAAKPIVTDVLQGFNGTIFAYGQTSSGKTHTMEGVLHDSEMCGVIPRIIQDIFEHIYTLDEALEFHIKISYFEIYLDKIRDLLDVSKSNLSVHEDANRVPYVKGATERFVASPHEVMQVMDEGKLNRKVASTKMNADSSRSHSIFLINVKQENTETETKLTGKLYLVDLAGSEKVGKTGAEGETLEEAKNINKSLSALGNVISALASGTKSHIPYRDSKMTRILQDSLGGNCRTTIIICCSPSGYNESETKSTLLFGVRAKTIKNTVSANVELTADQWRRKFEKADARAEKYSRLFKMAMEELGKWRDGENVEECDRADFSSTQTAAKAETTGNVSTPDSASKKEVPGFLDSPCSTTVGTERIKDTQVYSNLSGDKERELYKQMDEKDEQIDDLVQLVEQLKEQLIVNEDTLVCTKADSEVRNSEICRLQQENETSKAEVQEVLVALEDLAVNYDEKAHALESSSSETQKLANELQSKQTSLTKLQTELATVNELSETHKRRASDMLKGLFKDLYDMGIVSPSQVAQSMLNIDEENITEPGTFTAIDDEFTTARLLVSKVKSEVKTLITRCEKLDSTAQEKQIRLDENTQHLENTQRKLSQHENKVKTLSSCLKDVENKRRCLDDKISELHTEIARLRGQELDLNRSDANTSNTDVETALQIQSTNHKTQMDHIRSEIAEKLESILRLEESERNLDAELHSLRSENESVKRAKMTTELKLQGLQMMHDKRDQAREDLHGLEETVSRELNSLHSLRKLFVKELTDRARKIAVNDANTSQASGDADTKPGSSASENLSVMGSGSQVHRHRIEFLESNLDQLTKVHKSLVRDNADLRCELPKLEKKLRATAVRVESLEHALREAKEGANRDRKRYQQEVDRIKETVRNRYIARKAQIGAQIARPIRAGHAPGATFNSPVAIRGGGAAVHGIRGGASFSNLVATSNNA